MAQRGKARKQPVDKPNPFPKGPPFKTGPAAAYLSELGVPGCSQRSLIRMRLRMPEDPGDHGPEFYRGVDGTVYYFKADLDRYAAERMNELCRRGRAEQPGRLRTSGEAA